MKRTVGWVGCGKAPEEDVEKVEEQRQRTPDTGNRKPETGQMTFLKRTSPPPHTHPPPTLQVFPSCGQGDPSICSSRGYFLHVHIGSLCCRPSCSADFIVRYIPAVACPGLASFGRCIGIHAASFVGFRGDSLSHHGY